MSSKIDIAYIIPRPEIGGAERQLLKLLQSIDKGRFRTHVLCLDGSGSLMPEYVAAADSVHVIGRRHLFDIRALARTIETIRNIGPAVCHTYLYIANLFGGWAARLAGVPKVVASQRGLGIDPQHSRLKRVEQWLMNIVIAQFADTLTANSQAVSARMADVGWRPVEVIYNGIDESECPSSGPDVRSRLGFPEGATLLATIARLDPKKDLETLLRAFSRVEHAHPAIDLVVIGGGFDAYEKRLQALADQLRIADKVHFLGFRSDALELLAACDVSLLSSLTEGLPNAVLESMLLGKPVVATAVGGVPELITHGVEGLLVAPGDCRQMAANVLTLIEDPHLARKMGQRGRARARSQFGLSTMVHRSTGLYADGGNSIPEPVANGKAHDFVPISTLQERSADFYGRYFWKDYDVSADGHLDFMVKRIGPDVLQRAKTLLDIGSGSGKWAILLKKAFPHLAVTSLDLSRDNVKTAARNAAAAKADVRVVQGSVLDLPVAPEHFDIVVCAYMLQHTSDPGRGFMEAARAVRPRGTALFSIGRRNGWGGIHRHSRWLFTRVPESWRTASVKPLVPLYWLLVKLFKPGKASEKDLTKDLVDWVYNPLQNFIGESEIEAWFPACGLGREHLGYTGLLKSMGIYRGTKVVRALERVS